MSEPNENGSDLKEETKETKDVDSPVAPDLEKAKGDWMVAERKQRKRILLGVLGGAVFVVVAFAVWWAVFRLPSIPIGCEAAIQRLQTHCKLSRRDAINRLKKTPALLPNDPTRRETCRVLATAEHKFWRPRAIKALLKQVKKQAKTRPAPPRPAPPRPAPPRAAATGDATPKAGGGEEALPEGGKKKAGKTDAKAPVPAVIKADGPLTDSARIFIEQELIPKLIVRTYCPK